MKILEWPSRYMHWLHTRWPAGTVEKLPEVGEDGSTNVPGVYVSGDLTGIPLLKFSLDTGARVVKTIAADPALRAGRETAVAGAGEFLDLVIIGAGVSGMAAAVEAKKQGLAFRILEATEPFSTIVNFPRGKPIYTYPKAMTPAGDLAVTAEVKEALVEELRRQASAAGIEPVAARAERIERAGQELIVHLAGGESLRARRLLVAIGRSGNFRKLGVPGEELDKVYNRLHDPKDFCDSKALIVGGGDSALETAIALAQCGSQVTLSYRKKEFSRPKPDNLEKLEMLRRHPESSPSIEEPSSERVTTAAGPFLEFKHAHGRIDLQLGTQVKEIRENEVVLEGANGPTTIPNDAVFSMIGREPPLDFFRRSGIQVAGEMRPRNWIAMGLFLLFCIWLYNWKSGGGMSEIARQLHWFPFNLPDLLASAGGAIAAAAGDPRTLLGTLAISAAGPAFWYTLAYSLIVAIFGFQRIRRRKTPYITVQTLTTAGSSGAHTDSSSPGRSMSTTSSPTSHSGGGSGSASCRPWCLSRSASPSSARGSTADGSAPAAPWPRLSATRSGTRCCTARGGIASTWPAR
jgi:thioredoxin reductase